MRSYPEEVRRLAEIVRHLGLQSYESVGRMANAQAGSVQQRPVKLQALALRSGEEAGPSVAGIAREGEPERGEMHADLMGPSGLGKGRDERPAPKSFNDAIAGSRRLARRIDAPLPRYGDAVVGRLTWRCACRTR